MRHDTCRYLQQLAGEWRYTNGNDTIRICLRYARYLNTSFNTMDDVLFGWHEYKQGNTVIESIYQNRFMNMSRPDTFSNNSVSIGITMGSEPEYCNDTIKKAYGVITDYSQAKEPKYITVTLNATGTIMTWKQRDAEGYGQFTGATGMTLPREFILTKQ